MEIDALELRAEDPRCGPDRKLLHQTAKNEQRWFQRLLWPSLPFKDRKERDAVPTRVRVQRNFLSVQKRANNGKEETGFIGQFYRGIPRWQVIIEADMPANLTVSSHTTNYNFPALIFGILLIIIIICGNVLVCLSVYTEKALKTTTNYFIVSLAVADLLLAVLVLPLFVFTEVSRDTSFHRYFTCHLILYYSRICLQVARKQTGLKLL